MTQNLLPQDYGRTTIVLMPRDPTWMFSYWEVQPQAARAGSSHPVIRVFELDRSKTNGSRERLAFEISVSLEVRNWYVNVVEPGRSWFVELGLKASDGRFTLLARSNVVDLPWGRVSDVIDNRWMIYKEGSDKLIELSRAERVGRGSLEISRMLLRRWEMRAGVTSWRKRKKARP
jgi:hypothetical protein